MTRRIPRSWAALALAAVGAFLAARRRASCAPPVSQRPAPLSRLLLEAEADWHQREADRLRAEARGEVAA